jgi:hypothetical protein
MAAEAHEGGVGQSFLLPHGWCSLSLEVGRTVEGGPGEKNLAVGMWNEAYRRLLYERLPDHQRQCQATTVADVRLVDPIDLDEDVCHAAWDAYTLLRGKPILTASEAAEIHRLVYQVGDVAAVRKWIDARPQPAAADTPVLCDDRVAAVARLAHQCKIHTHTHVHPVDEQLLAARPDVLALIRVLGSDAASAVHDARLILTCVLRLPPSDQVLAFASMTAVHRAVQPTAAPLSETARLPCLRPRRVLSASHKKRLLRRAQQLVTGGPSATP